MEMTKSFVERTRTNLCVLTNIFRVDAIVILVYQNILYNKQVLNCLQISQRVRSTRDCQDARLCYNSF